MKSSGSSAASFSSSERMPACEITVIASRGGPSGDKRCQACFKKYQRTNQNADALRQRVSCDCQTRRDKGGCKVMPTAIRNLPQATAPPDEEYDPPKRVGAVAEF